MENKEYQIYNFYDLVALFHGEKRAAGAVEIMRAEKKGKGIFDLFHLLRHHDEEGIKKKETYLRDDFDFLLASYSILEIASIIQYVPSQLPQDFRSESLWVLSHKAVRKYYEVNYPLLLPSLFRNRLNNEIELFEKDASHITHSIFASFLGIVNRIREDEEVDLFQWFLDGGSADGFGIDETMAILCNPSKTMKALLTEPDFRTIPEQSVCGAQRFLSICGELDRLFQEAHEFPIFQAALWYHFSYWFELLSDVIGNRLKTILISILEWQSKLSERDAERQSKSIDQKIMDYEDLEAHGASTDDLSKHAKDLHKVIRDQVAIPDQDAIKHYVTSSMIILERLLSGNYGKGLGKIKRKYVSESE